MTAPAEAYPLAWPAGRPRTDPYRRARSKFETTLGRARDELVREQGPPAFVPAHIPGPPTAIDARHLL